MEEAGINTGMSESEFLELFDPSQGAGLFFAVTTLALFDIVFRSQGPEGLQETIKALQNSLHKSLKYERRQDVGSEGALGYLSYSCVDSQNRSVKNISADVIKNAGRVQYFLDTQGVSTSFNSGPLKYLFDKLKINTSSEEVAAEICSDLNKRRYNSFGDLLKLVAKIVLSESTK